MDASGVLTHEVDCYDPTSNTWSRKADLPTARWHCAGAVANGKFYVIGGDNAAGAALNKIEVYNPDSNTWASENPLPTARSGTGAGVVNGVIYAIGGGDPSNPLTTNEAFTVCGECGVWVTKASMPSARINAAADAING